MNDPQFPDDMPKGLKQALRQRLLAQQQTEKMEERALTAIRTFAMRFRQKLNALADLPDGISETAFFTIIHQFESVREFMGKASLNIDGDRRERIIFFEAIAEYATFSRDYIEQHSEQ